MSSTPTSSAVLSAFPLPSPTITAQAEATASQCPCVCYAWDWDKISESIVSVFWLIAEILIGVFLFFVAVFLSTLLFEIIGYWWEERKKAAAARAAGAGAGRPSEPTSLWSRVKSYFKSSTETRSNPGSVATVEEGERASLWNHSAIELSDVEEGAREDATVVDVGDDSEQRGEDMN
ncbi:hypothetical protein FA95DRAFT_611637 [Auriscalpium vulgare]|uniref:Uncharacterized protein n=1 Tax=Auriscalpium vulgare TaxID=40419 RepID=A0ACB8REW9_9AGAM|nr:hypothetical protein FA95DRAFT_611637 [Auriscalpium vulgare]